MANPQKEDGYTPIANEIVEELWKVNLSAYEGRVLWYLFRKTYGWNQKTDRIALSQFSKDIGIDRRLVHRAIKGLSSKQMIVIYKDDKGNVSYCFQKDYEKWQLSSKKMTVIDRDTLPSSKKMTKRRKVSSKEIPTKETITTKATIKKTIPPIIPHDIDLEVWKEFEAMRKKIKKPLTDYAKRLIIKDLEKINKATGQDKNEILEQSIKNDWQGVFEIKQGGNNGNGNNGRTGTGKAYQDAHGPGDTSGQGKTSAYPVDCEETIVWE